MYMKLTNKFVSYVGTQIELSETDKEKITFVLASILSDFSKFLLIFLFFLPFGYGISFLQAFALTSLLRAIAGGFHFNTYWSCFGYSFLYYFVSIVVSNYFTIIHMPIFAVISSMIILTLSPMPSAQRVKIMKLSNGKAKLFTLVVLIPLLLLGFGTGEQLSRMSFAIIILQALQMIVLKGVKIYEKST